MAIISHRVWIVATDHGVCGDTFGRTRGEAIRLFMNSEELEDTTWEQLRRHGYRCVRAVFTWEEPRG